MDFALSEEQSAIFDMAKAFGEEHIAPHAMAWEKTGTIPKDLWPKVAGAAVGRAGAAVGRAGAAVERAVAAVGRAVAAVERAVAAVRRAGAAVGLLWGVLGLL